MADTTSAEGGHATSFARGGGGCEADAAAAAARVGRLCCPPALAQIARRAPSAAFGAGCQAAGGGCGGVARRKFTDAWRWGGAGGTGSTGGGCYSPFSGERSNPSTTPEHSRLQTRSAVERLVGLLLDTSNLGAAGGALHIARLGRALAARSPRRCPHFPARAFVAGGAATPILPWALRGAQDETGAVHHPRRWRVETPSCPIATFTPKLSRKHVNDSESGLARDCGSI